MELSTSGVAQPNLISLKGRLPVLRDRCLSKKTPQGGAEPTPRDASHRPIKTATRDINLEKAETTSAHTDEARFHLAAIVESSDDAILSKSLDGTILSWNRGAEKLYGYTAAEIVGQSIALLVPPDRRLELERILAGLQRGAFVDHFETRRAQKGGHLIPVSLTISPIRDSESKVIAASTIARDIRERKIAEAALFTAQERAEVTLSSIGDAVISTDASSTVDFMNDVAEEVIGLSRVKGAGQPIGEILRIQDATSHEPIDSLIEKVVVHDRIMHLPPNCVVVRPDGVEIPIEDSVAPIHNKEGQPVGAVMVFRDVSATRNTALEMAHSAEHDFLTGLPNRMLLNDRIGQAIAWALRHKKQVGVVFLDLDGFKHINDSLGHPVGDKLLQSIAGRLVKCARF